MDGLLAVSRLGRHEMKFTRIDMQALAGEVMGSLRVSMAGRDVTFDIKSAHSVTADCAMMRQVLANLFSNAIKSTASRRHATIAFGGTSQDGENVYYVKDNGLGFDMRHADRLFRVFQRLHGEEDFEGTGIGLVTVKRIIQHHGGRVWAEGEPGVGATFFFALPNGDTEPDRDAEA